MVEKKRETAQKLAKDKVMMDASGPAESLLAEYDDQGGDVYF